MSVVLDLEDDRLVLHAGPLDNGLAKTIPGFIFKGNRWSAVPSWGTALAARGVFGNELRLGPGAVEWGKEQVEREQRIASLKLPDDPEPYAEGLYPPQQVGVGWLVYNLRAALFDDPGVGKGVQTAVALGQLDEQEFPALIVTPKSVKHGHRKEIEKWAPHLTPYVVSGDAPARRKAIEAGLADPHGVLIVNWEQLRLHSMLAPYGSTPRTDKQKEPGLLNDERIRTVLVDEAHRAKDPTSAQTRALKAITTQAERVWMTTGTPIPDPIGFWSVMHILAPWDFPSRVKYQDRYTLTEQVYAKGGREVTVVKAFNPRTEPELDRIVSPYMMRRTIREVLPDLPPLMYRTLWVEMDPRQRKAYDGMAKDMLTRVEGGLLVATDPMVQSGRLLQLASAMPVLDDEGQVVELAMPSSKVQAVLDWLEDNPSEQVVVFAQSRKLIELLDEKLEKGGHTHALITGPVNEGQRKVNEEMFQAGDVRVLSGTYGAMAEGITLTAAANQLMLQRSFELIKNQQADGRTLRVGQDRPVTIFDVVSVNSYDEACFEAGAFKDATAQQLLKDPEWIRKALQR